MADSNTNTHPKKTPVPPQANAKVQPAQLTQSTRPEAVATSTAANPPSAPVRKTCGGRWRSLSGCAKFQLIWYLFWLSPFIILGSVWLIVLGALIPIGFGFGLIKHRAPILWFVVLTLVNIGGLADLTADIWLLVRIMIYYMTNYSVNPFGDMPSEEYRLIFTRMIVTLITGIPSITFLFFMNSDGWVAFTGEKKANIAKPGNGAAGVCLIIIWKLAMICARLNIIWQILTSLIKHKKITEETEKNTRFWETAATLEVLWSAIPLGILTALEVFYFEDMSHVTPTKVWELIKLGALVIDLIGVSYFFYFDVLGMNKIVHKCLGEHDHHNGSINSERSPLVVDLLAGDSNV